MAPLGEWCKRQKRKMDQSHLAYNPSEPMGVRETRADRETWVNETGWRMQWGTVIQERRNVEAAPRNKYITVLSNVLLADLLPTFRKSLPRPYSGAKGCNVKLRNVGQRITNKHGVMFQKNVNFTNNAVTTQTTRKLCTEPLCATLYRTCCKVFSLPTLPQARRPENWARIRDAGRDLSHHNLAQTGSHPPSFPTAAGSSTATRPGCRAYHWISL
jgi:hypothetical protein